MVGDRELTLDRHGDLKYRDIEIYPEVKYADLDGTGECGFIKYNIIGDLNHDGNIIIGVESFKSIKDACDHIDNLIFKQMTGVDDR